MTHSVTPELTRLDQALPSRRRLLTSALAAPLLGLPLLASANTKFPTKQVTWIVPFPAGATHDVVVRQICRKLSDQWSYAVVVDNRSGAGGIVGIGAGAKAPKDGHTLTGVANSFVANTILRSDLPYNAFTDFAPVTMIGSVPHILVAASNLRVQSMDALLAQAKASPGKLAYSSGGNGTMSHLAGEMFNSAAKVDLLHVPYRGQGPALADVVSGQVALTFANLPEALPHLKQGNIKGIALAQAARSALVPEVPTFAELGMRSVISDSWFGVVAPAGTPSDVVAFIHSEISKVLAQSEISTGLRASGMQVAALSPEEFRAHMASCLRDYRQVITSAKITLDK